MVKIIAHLQIGIVIILQVIINREPTLGLLITPTEQQVNHPDPVYLLQEVIPI